jgi:hypothetical protein
MPTISDPYPGRRPSTGRRAAPRVPHRQAPGHPPHEAPTPGVPGTAGVQSSGGYIHCGEPMHAAGSGLRSIYAPMSTEPVPAEQTSEGALEVFQMEIPE